MRRPSITAVYLLLGLASSQASAAPEPLKLTLVASATVSTVGPTGPAQPSTTALSLDALIDTALAHNAQVAISAAEITQAEALYELAAAQAFFAGNLTGLFGGPVPEAQTTVVNDLNTLTPASDQGDFDFGKLGVQVRLSAELIQPLYTFDKIGSLKRATTHLVKAAEHKQTVTEADVLVNVNKAFWTIQLTRKLTKSLDEGVRILEGVLSKIEQMLDDDSGQVTENDRLRLKYALATLSVRRIEAVAIYKVAQQAMRLLIGYPQERALLVAERDLDELPAKQPRIEELIVWARNYRPELKALKQVVQAAETFTEYRRSNFFPTLFLGGALSMVYTSNATDQTNPFIYDPYNTFSVAVGLGLRVELDVFTKIAQLEQAKAEVRVRQAQVDLVSQLVDLEVRKLNTEIGAGYERITKLERANRTARGWLTASTLGYDIGTGAADELIDAFLAWAASEAELQTTRLNVLSKLIEMSRATGKLVGPHSDR